MNVDLTADDGLIVAEQPVSGRATTARSVVNKGTPVITVRPNSAAPEPASALAELENVELAAGSR